MDHKKELMQLIEITSGRYSTYDVFRDFIECAAMAISNTVDIRFAIEREEQYMQIISKYTEKEQGNFPKMLDELTLALDEEPTDVMGYVFMKMKLGSKELGQFFTPFNLCELMASITFYAHDEIYEVNEPAVGGGANIIAFANQLKENGINYQQKLKVVAQDLDYKAVYMCYVQFSLLGIPAKVIQGDTLSKPPTDNIDSGKNIFYTPMWIINGWR